VASSHGPPSGTESRYTRCTPAAMCYRPETLRMPAMQAIMFGNPPAPALVVQFREQPPDNRTAYALAPDVFLLFQGPELALLYVCNAYKNIAELD